MASAIEVRRSTESTPAGLKKLSTKLVRVNDAGEIHVYVVLTEWSPEHVAALEALGLRVEATVPTRRLIQGWVPSHALDDVAALDAVKEVKPPAYGMREGAGDVNTPGDEILGAAAARAAFGVSGAGVKVGVISDGVDHLADSVMSNDLPAGVQVLSPGSGDEGTALLEIVHDLAPGAALAFYGPSTSVDMANGINALAAAGARVVMDDLSFFFEPKFEDGLIAETVRSFATGGRVYVSSAGNRAQQHYRATYTPVTGQNFPDSDYPAVHNYLPGSIDIGNTLVVPPFCSLTVDPAVEQPVWRRFRRLRPVHRAHVGLCHLRHEHGVPDGHAGSARGGHLHQHDRVARHRLHRGVGVPPREPARLAHPRLLRAPRLLRNPGLQYVTPSESLAGNHSLVEALPIAAVNAATPAQAEVYSSQGPGTISFPFPEVRAVPVLTSVDCVPTKTGELGFFVLPFCGTSAAAPHVAGIAALLIERAPTLSTEQLRGVLTGTAVDLGPPGFDFTYGFGRADAFQALSFVSSGPHVQLDLRLNRHSIAPGDFLEVGLFESNEGTATVQDFYFGALVPPALSTTLGCPAGDALLFFADAFTRTVVLCYLTASPQSFAPLFASMTIPAHLPTTAVDSFGLTWPADIPAGTFTFLIFATPPGAFADGNVGPTDLTDLVLDVLQASP